MTPKLSGSFDSKGANVIMEMAGVQPGLGASYWIRSASRTWRPTMITRLDVVGLLIRSRQRDEGTPEQMLACCADNVLFAPYVE
jgi:hypothetical protein